MEQAFKKNRLTAANGSLLCTMQPWAVSDKGTVETSLKPNENTENCAEAGTEMFPRNISWTREIHSLVQ